MPMYDNYPPVGFHFKVEFRLDDATDGDSRFSEVSGLSSELGVEELAEGGENRFTHRLPSRAKHGNLVLKRGMLNGSRLIRWFRDAVEDFEFKPADLLVTLLNEEHKPLAGWSFIGTWPVKWSVSDLRAQENSVVIETIELAYRYYTRVEV